MAAILGSYIANLLLQIVFFPVIYYVMRKQYDLKIKGKALVIPYFVSAALTTLFGLISSEQVLTFAAFLYPVCFISATLYYANSKAKDK